MMLTTEQGKHALNLTTNSVTRMRPARFCHERGFSSFEPNIDVAYLTKWNIFEPG